MNKLKPAFVCSICNELIHNEYGNNAWPINEGKCCDVLSLRVVS
jgi:hypothetical protein